MKLTLCTTLLLCLGSIGSTLAAESTTEKASARAPEKVTAKSEERVSEKTEQEERWSPPATQNASPKTSNMAHQTSYSYSQPSYGYPRPSSYGYSPPASYGYSRPSSYSYSPPASYGYSRPSSYSYSQPASYGYSRPSYGYSQPASYGYSRPSYGYSPPASYSYSQPSYAKPSYSVPAPMTYAPKPIYPAAKPSAPLVVPAPAPLVVPAPAPIVIPVPKPVIIPSGPSLGGVGLGGKLPLGGYGLGGLGLGGLGGLGLSSPFVIAPVAPVISNGKCPTIGLLRYRQAQLQDALQTSKRACGSKKDGFLDKWDSDDDENAGDLDLFDRSMLSEINSPLEMALLDPTALVELDENKRSGLCASFRIISRTSRLISRLLKFLFSSKTCPPIAKLLRDAQEGGQETKRFTPDYDFMLNQDAFKPNNFNHKQHKQNSDLAGPENFKFGLSAPSFYGPPSYLPPYGPNLLQNSYPGHYPPPQPQPQPQYVRPGKAKKKPVVVVSPVSKPYGIGKCRAQNYLRARRDQLNGILEKAKAPKACLLQSKDERSLKSDGMSVSSFQELALINPFSRVELVESDGRTRNEVCNNPRILLRTLSILGRLIRFLFTTDPCPPIQHLSSWILNKLDTRSLSSSAMISR